MKQGETAIDDTTKNLASTGSDIFASLKKLTPKDQAGKRETDKLMALLWKAENSDARDDLWTLAVQTALANIGTTRQHVNEAATKINLLLQELNAATTTTVTTVKSPTLEDYLKPLFAHLVGKTSTKYTNAKF